MLHYKTHIKDFSAEWVVFLHGFGGSSSTWYKQIACFAGRFNLLLVDLQGHGLSRTQNAGNKTFSYEKIALDVLEVASYLHLPPCHFVGCSLGTIVVRQVAELKPDMVKTMTLAGAVVRFNIRSKFLMQFARTVRNMVPYMWIYRFYSKILMPRKHHELSRRLFVCNALKMQHKEFVRWIALTANVCALLQFFRCTELPIPALYLMGDEDYMFLPQVRHLLKTHTQYSALAVVPGAGHVCNVDNAAFFNKQAIHFLTENNK